MFNASIEMFKKTMIGKKVSVVGLGVSNLPAIEFLGECGAIISACDKTPENKLSEEALDIIHKHCDFWYLGDDYLDHFEGQDIILRSPGIKPSMPQFKAAVEKGVVLTSEMELFMSLCPCKMIGVTGSDGKTTTTTLIGKILEHADYKCHIGGNIGTPLLNKLDKISSTDFVVLELSSFQLMDMRVSPDIAVITNISPNHLDYHRDMTEYVAAKAQIFKNQSSNGKLVINRDNASTAAFYGKQNGTAEFFSRKYKEGGAFVDDGYLCYNGEKIVKAADIRIKGSHNVENYLAAIAAVREFVSTEDIVEVAENFGGVEHRMEFVREVDGISFYNDSIGSSPTRTIAGLVAHEGDIVLIAGGYDKNLDYEELGKVIMNTVQSLVVVGQTADKIKRAVVKAFGRRDLLPISHESDFEKAIYVAFNSAKALKRKGVTCSVILSPASASFDMFKNFMERGDKFKEIVHEIKPASERK